MSERQDELTVSLRATLDEYMGAFGRFDIDVLSSYWDREESDPLYIAEEVAGRMTSHDAIQAYWSATAGRLARLWTRTRGHAAAPRATDLAQLAFDMDWACRLGSAPDDPPIGGSLQVAALYRRRGDRWLLVSWVEAPLGPLPWLRRLYQEAGARIAGEG